MARNMVRMDSNGRRSEDAQVTRATLNGDRNRQPIFRVTFIPGAQHAANTTFARHASGFGDSVLESASLASLAPDSAQGRAEADAKAWTMIELWAQRGVWAVVTIVLLVDIVTTFGHGLGLQWHM